MPGLRAVFMGSPEFALPSLRAILDAGHEIACVYAPPPRPAERGHRERPCAVHAFALAAGLPVRTPASLKNAAEQEALAALRPDVGVTAAYGLLLPCPVLEAARLGFLNVHASLLPRWRGAAPIQRAILAGDRETGVTIMQVDEGLDTGPILLVQRIPIGSETTAGTLHDTLAELGARLVVDALEGVAEGRLVPSPQPKGVEFAYAAKIDRAERRIDWRREAKAIDRQVRAFAPSPGAWFEFGGERIKLLAAEIAASPAGGEPGRVLDERLAIACGDGALRAVRLQRAGRAPLEIDAFLRGYPIPPGTRLA
jgi:methionyl-tRNA formyltransferase